MTRRAEPIIAAYEATGAAAVACPTCPAGVGAFCRDPASGLSVSVPHVRRLALAARAGLRVPHSDANDPPLGSEYPSGDPDLSQRQPPAHNRCATAQYVDPSEPRHPRNED